VGTVLCTYVSLLLREAQQLRNRWVVWAKEPCPSRLRKVYPPVCGSNAYRHVIVLAFAVDHPLIASLLVALHLQPPELGYQALGKTEARVNLYPVRGERGVELLELTVLGTV
jgi:hypothetical protein